MKSFPVLALAVAGMALGCHQTRKPEQPSTVLPIQRVVGSPVSYAHRLITVRGCFVDAYERSTIQPCDSDKHEDIVWLANAEEFVRRNNLPNVPKELQARPIMQLEFAFKYDEAKSRAAWARLTAAEAKHKEVVITGQFDTIASEKANTDPYGFGHGFGHLGQYKHRLILVDLLDLATH